MQARTEGWLPSGIHLEWRANDTGSIVLPAIAAHRVSVHASTATPSSCRATDLHYVRERGDIDLVPAGEEGGYDAFEPSRTLEVQIPPGFLARVAEEMDGSYMGLTVRHVVRDARIEHLVWALEEEKRSPAPAGPLYVSSLGVALAVHLLGLHASVHEATPGLSPRQLQRVVDFIEANLDGRLSLLTLARVAGVSSAHLRRWFKERKGVSVHRYVVRRRVERARVLLLQRALPTSEIALAAGFSHQTHMARWMRRELGVTPRELLRTIE